MTLICPELLELEDLFVYHVFEHDFDTNIKMLKRWGGYRRWEGDDRGQKFTARGLVLDGIENGIAYGSTVCVAEIHMKVRPPCPKFRIFLPSQLYLGRFLF